ncbi:uncharacterized protein M6B38_360675 [Iris pallida]|uniref:Uncharacterized protein n=1 Tax=Iris pallida TaxID=29817 RepID=A0AAX6GIZ9_IRIPA|nr:uncharacterized protein M6B38_360675 [Iris pallida]
MGSLIETIQKKRFLIPSMPYKDELPISSSSSQSSKAEQLGGLIGIGIRKRISSFSVNIQPCLASTASSAWAFRKSRSMPSLGELAGGGGDQEVVGAKLGVAAVEEADLRQGRRDERGGDRAPRPPQQGDPQARPLQAARGDREAPPPRADGPVGAAAHVDPRAVPLRLLQLRQQLRPRRQGAAGGQHVIIDLQ